ncbi:MAG: hypothetical protein KDC24_02400 [Saprospiraceae bacterium]|nr:hypothetical protein [Saprospiraceae bacterium]
MKTYLVILCLIFPFLIFSQDIEKIKKAKPLVMTGGLNVGSQFYKVNGINARLVNPMWIISGNANLNVYGVLDLPFSFTIGKQGTNASYPSFRQFGVSPTYKWITIHAGWRNMSFSRYTLNAHTFLGAGVELNPGKWRIGGMYGRLRKARDFNPDPEFSNIPPVYKRMGYGFKIGYGTENQYLDLIYFKAEDKINSLAIQSPDSTVTPGENAVLGYNLRSRLFKNVYLNSEAALSLFTRDIRSTEASELLPVDISGFFTPRFSSRLNYALKAGIETRFKNWNFNLDYERIMPQFESMGSYFFANDVENITISPRGSLYKNKVQLYGTFGIQRNNLLADRLETTRRFIGNGGMNYFSGNHFGLQVNLTSVNINQTERIQSLGDSIRVAIVNTNYMVSPYWTWTDSISNKTIVVLANYQELNDRNPFTREFTDMQTVLFNGTFNSSNLKNGLSIQAGINYDKIFLAALTNMRWGATAGAGWNQKGGKFGCRLSTTYNLSYIDNKKDGAIITGNVNIDYSPWPKHKLSFFTNVNRTLSSSFTNYTEILGGVQYGLVF